MAAFNVTATAILVIAALVTVWFAWKAGRDSRRATEAAERTVAAVETLLAVARDTEASSRAAADAARQTVDASRELVAQAQATVEVAHAAREADEHYRMVRRLQAIGGLLESAFEKAADEKGYRPIAGWRCIEQRAILPLLFGVGPPLARCETFAGTSQAESVFSAAVEARAEVAERLRQLHIR